MSTVGLIANPLAGKDVRRFVSAASVNSDRNKIEILKRCVLGALDAGAENILLAPDFRNLSLRAVESLNLGNKIIEMPIEIEGGRQDTTRAADIFKKEKVEAIISLGGDGTQRDLISGWIDGVIAAIANPASIGLASIAGRSHPVYFDDDMAVSVSCDPHSTKRVTSPIMPGSVSDVGITEIKQIELGDTFSFKGPGVLAFDGERDFVLGEEEVKITVLRNGPRVIDPNYAIQTAAANKVFLREE